MVRNTAMLSVSALRIAAVLGLIPRVALAGETIRGPIDAVNDGDTLTVAGAKVRLFGIDAPELHQECTGADGAPYPCGRKAQMLLAALTRGKPAVCEVRERDRYGRAVAVCVVDRRDLGAAMVRSGNAVDFARYSKGASTNDERIARRDHLGLWAGDFTRPEDWRKEHRRSMSRGTAPPRLSVLFAGRTRAGSRAAAAPSRRQPTSGPARPAPPPRSGR